jgi:hypothetical protein
MIQVSLQAEIGKVVGADLIAQEGEEFLALRDKGTAVDVMAVFDLFDDCVQLALYAFCNAASEYLRIRAAASSSRAACGSLRR